VLKNGSQFQRRTVAHGGLALSQRFNIKSLYDCNKRFHSTCHLPNVSYQRSVSASSKYTAVSSLWFPVRFIQCDSTVKIKSALYCHWHFSQCFKSCWINPHILFPPPCYIIISSSHHHATSSYIFQRSNFLLLWNSWSWKFWSNVSLNVYVIGISASGFRNTWWKMEGLWRI